VKLTPNVTDIVEIADGAVQGGACGITAINTVRGMAIDIRRRRPVLSTIYGGLSGPAIKPVGVAAVHRLYKALPGVPICGVGGIWNAADAMEYVQAGASCVQVGTANFTKPDVLVEITNDFRNLLADLGFSSTSEAVGAAHQRAKSG
jgi:dihydroorotate dehydrogenase (NAD+) catalytic subunit